MQHAALLSLLPTLVMLAALAASWAITGIVRRYALARSILDVPNHRSSHTVPTPRGGGLAIVCTFMAGLLALAAAGVLPPRAATGIGGGALVIALVGWLDDRRGVRASIRALVQAVAGAWALWWLGGMPSLALGSSQLDLGVAGSLVALVAIVWFTNLFNFMDGIDGIAGGQATAGGVVGGVLLLMGGQAGLAALSLLLAACSAGFLVWNWSPARIFMGDVGSSTLGFIVATVAIAAENARAVPLPVSMLLAGPFVLDATVTLVRRMAHGETWYEAHRSHAYQRAVQSGLSHATVAGIVVAIDVLLGVALVTTRGAPRLQLAVVVAGFVALGVLYLAVERRRPMFERGARGAG